jgi:tetratricopeptide (TPR) repeat protein
MYKLVNKAETYKKQGFYSKELEVYEEIHKNFLPNSSSLYKRPAVLYEKEGNYQKAYDLCEKAINLINDEKISGTTTSFEKMSEILSKKLKGSKKSNVSKKKSIPKISIISIIFLFLLFFSVYYLATKENSYDNIQIDLSEMKKFDQANTNNNTKDIPQKYPITNNMILKTKKNINSNQSVINSVIISDNSSIGFGILVNSETSYSESKKLCNSFVKELSKVASLEYNLKYPTITSYGEIYDYYSIYISVGTSSKKEDIILKAYKIKGGKEIEYK